MSAVSSESPRAGADLAEAERNHSTDAAVPDHPSDGPPAAKDFGPNEWLVDELYQRYLADPGSVDMAWWSFFSDYQPPRGGAPRGEGQSGVLSPPRPAAPDAQPAARGNRARRLPPSPRFPGGAPGSGCAARPRGRRSTWPPAWVCRPRPACGPSPPSC